jgi:N-acyl homoserine lactone hydrolase
MYTVALAKNACPFCPPAISEVHAMKMHILSGGRLRMKQHIYLPDAPRDRWIELPVSCFLFRHSQGNVLFDTGCHPDVARDPAARWGPLAESVVPVMNHDDNVIAALTRIGLAPEDIDIVVNSHVHCDHCGCNEFFGNATVYVHGDEIRHAQKPDHERHEYFAADWQHPLPVTEVTGETDIFGDGRLVLLPLPGHTPGLTGLLTQLPNSGAYLLASDAVALRQNLDAEVMPRNIWNPNRQSRSLAEIRKIERSGATVICGHDAKQASAFKNEKDFYD